MARPTMRHLAALLSGGLLLCALAVLAVRGPAATAHVSAYALSLDDDATAHLDAGRLARAQAAFRGGPITASTGEVVDVRVSDALPVETATPEGWAEFLVHLAHGSELAQVDVYIATFDEMQEICGARALGCYGRDQLVAVGEAVADTSPEEIVRHEYGHHIAAHRRNDPWVAIDWGPKRWASAASVCARVARNEAFPGDEGLLNYQRNPGEAWAEVYRLMDERRAGITTARWPIIAQSFFPDEAAYGAAEQDVLQPWTPPRARVYTRTFGKKTSRIWWIPLVTPLDGALRVSATVPNAGGSVDVALVGADRTTVVRRAQWIGQRLKRLDGSICGQRSLFVRVTQQGLVGRIRVSVTTA